MRKTTSLGVLAILLAAPFAARGSQLDLLSAVPAGRASDTALGSSQPAAVSTDGRYLAFLSDARNLVGGQVDLNDGSDVFLQDRVTGKTVLVSHAADSSATAANAPSSSVSMSRDGRWIVFVSAATDLIAGRRDPGKLSDVFLYDRVSGRTSLVSRSRASASTPGNGLSDGPAMSADGRWIAFHSEATDLVNGPSDLNSGGDVFLYDRQAGRTSLVSRAAGAAAQTGNAKSGNPSISADGRWVAFYSDASNLVSGGTVGGIHVWDRVTGAMVESPGAGVGYFYLTLAISGNGECVVYSSFLNSEVPGQQDPNDGSDVFLFHRPTRATKLVSHAYGSQTRAGNQISTVFSVSDDCGWVAFESYATDLVAGGSQDPPTQVYLYERASGRISQVSRVSGSEPAAPANLGGLSADGSTVVFLDSAPGVLAPPKETPWIDVILYDRRSGRTTLVSQVEGAAPSHGGNGNSSAAVVGPDGKWVAFATDATDLEPGVKDLNRAADVYLWSRATAGHELVTRHDPTGVSRTPVLGAGAGDLSADGRYAVFASRADDLLPRLRDKNGSSDVFVYDRVARTTRLVSRSLAAPQQTANGFSGEPAISADGRYIVYESTATDLVPGQAPQDPGQIRSDVFLYDQLTGTTTLVSRRGGPVVPFGGRSPRISADGSTIVFLDSYTDQLFLCDRATGTLALVSHTMGSPTTASEAGGSGATVSADGRFVAFYSQSPDLVPTDDPYSFVSAFYLYDRTSGEVTRVGFNNNDALVGSTFAVISGDGRWVVFQSEDQDVVPGQVDVEETPDLFLWDRVSRTTRLLTHTPDSAVTTVGTRVTGGGSFGFPRFSADGRWLLFAAFGTLVAGQPSYSVFPGLFLFDTVSGTTTPVGTVPGAVPGGPLTIVDGAFSLSPDGRYAAYAASPLLPADPADEIFQVYLYDRVSGKTALVSAAPGATAPGNGGSGFPIVANGGFVLFNSIASNLTSADFNGTTDVFLYSPGAP